MPSSIPFVPQLRQLHHQLKPVEPHLRTSIGRAYERHVIEFISTSVRDHGLGFSNVIHTGVRSSQDGGIDVRAIWSNVRILCQCKDSRGTLSNVREIESVVYHHRRDSDEVIGIFFGSRGFTQPAIERARSSQVPIILIHLLSPRLIPTEDQTRFGWKGVYPNSVAVRILEPLSFVTSYTSDSDHQLLREPVLWDGKRGCRWQEID